MGILDNKVAVITGSTRGLGLAIARLYAQEGASVVISSRKAEAVAQTVNEFKAAGLRAVGLACDISKPEDIRALADLAVQEFGHYDIWVNNAGMSPPYGATIHQPADYFIRVVHTNILGTYHGSRIAMEHFLGRGSGKLINVVGRGWTGRPVPLQNAYASSKAWMRSFTQAMGKEYKDSGVQVFAFNPGLVDTDMLRKPTAIQGFEHNVQMLRNIIPMFGNPPDVPAQKALWLASPATDGKTGLMVNVGSRWKIMFGAVRFGINRLLGRVEYPELDVSTIPPAI